jgi:hypothetical protein
LIVVIGPVIQIGVIVRIVGIPINRPGKLLKKDTMVAKLPETPAVKVPETPAVKVPETPAVKASAATVKPSAAVTAPSPKPPVSDSIGRRSE